MQTTGKHVSDDSSVTVTVYLWSTMECRQLVDMSVIIHGVQTTGRRVSDYSSVTVTVYMWSTMECRQLVNMSVMTAVSR